MPPICVQVVLCNVGSTNQLTTQHNVLLPLYSHHQRLVAEC